MTDPRLDSLWRFVRRDMSPAEFEQWAHSEPSLEAWLGPELYVEVVSADYRDREAVWRLRHVLEKFARAQGPMACECLSLAGTAIVDMADPGRSLETIAEVVRRGDPWWWLSLSRCSVCGTHWLVAQEERQNDLILLHRLSPAEAQAVMERNEWPTDFDRYETLLRLGKEAGHSVIFVDPIGDSSLAWTMTDLARERPEIRVDELAELLNLDVDTARVIAREAARRHDADISFE